MVRQNLLTQSPASQEEKIKIQNMVSTECIGQILSQTIQVRRPSVYGKRVQKNRQQQRCQMLV